METGLCIAILEIQYFVARSLLSCTWYLWLVRIYKQIIVSGLLKKKKSLVDNLFEELWE